MTATTVRPMPDVGWFLTDGKLLVQVLAQFKETHRVLVEDSRRPSVEFVIEAGARWRRVIPNA